MGPHTPHLVLVFAGAAEFRPASYWSLLLLSRNGLRTFAEHACKATRQQIVGEQAQHKIHPRAEKSCRDPPGNRQFKYRNPVNHSEHSDNGAKRRVPEKNAPAFHERNIIDEMSETQRGEQSDSDPHPFSNCDSGNKAKGSRTYVPRSCATTPL